MLNPSKKYGSVEDNLQKSIACIFAKQFNPSEFFPVLAQITDDPDLSLPANLIFSIYNLLIRQEPQTAFKGLAKIQEANPNSAANIAGLVVKSAYDAYTKKYKQSLESLNKAFQICEQPNADRQFVSFYVEVIARMIQIHDFAAFRRQYLNLMEKILKKYEDQIDNNQILRAMSQQRENLKQKVCTITKRTNFGQFASSNSNSNTMNLTKFTFKLKQSGADGSQNSSKEKSLSSSKRSSFYSPRSKLQSNYIKDLKNKKYINPYGLMGYNQSQKNNCIFM